MIKQFIEKLKKDKYNRNVVICFIVALILISIPLLLVELQHAKIADVETIYDTRSTKYASDKVKLVDNSLFINDAQGYYTSDFYVVNLLQDFHIDFYNTLNLNSTNHELSYLKSVVVSLVVEGEEGTILQETLSDYAPGYYEQSRGEVASDATACVLNQSVELNYSRFTDRFTEIREILTGITCTAQIKVVYTASCYGLLNDEQYSYQETMTSYIPVLSSGGLLSIDHVYRNSTDLQKLENTYHSEINYFWFVVAILCDLIALGLLTCLIISWVQYLKENARQKYIHKILNEYDDILVFTTQPLQEAKYKITLQNFEDMVKVETELSMPIVYTYQDEQYDFYVYAGDVVYTYQYRVND